MNRRRLLQAMLGSAALPLLPAAARADAWADAFAAKTHHAPWLRAFQGLAADVEPMQLTLQGRLPAGLRGSFYRNGPARHELGGVRYRHLFDGDGMVQRYRIDARGITHFGRFVRTEKFVTESRAGRFTRGAFGTLLPGMEEPASPDAANTANTSVVHHGGELLALWEGGSATRLDAQTLDTLGPRTWRDDHEGMPFSAHPKVEADGTLWNFGVSSMQGLLSIYRISPRGELLQAHTIELPGAAMIHDFAVTARRLVFLLPPFEFDGERRRDGATFLDSHVWHADRPMRVLVLDKNDLDRPQWFELPTGFVFHTANAWEDPAAQRLHLGYMRLTDATLATQRLSGLMRGEYSLGDPPRLALAELDLAGGRARQTLMAPEAEFPRIDPRRIGQRHRHVFAVGRSRRAVHPWFDSVQRFDVERGTVDSHGFDGQLMVEEHLFVPAPGGHAAEGTGWLIGTGYDLRRRAMVFNVFDAQRLADGPLAQATMPRVMPLGLHGTFVPA